MRFRFSWFITAIALCFLTGLTGCGDKKGVDKASAPDITQYANCLYISEHEGYDVAEVSRPDGSLMKRYILIPRNKEVPQGIPEGIVLRVPFERGVVFSDVYSALLEELSMDRTIAGVADAGYITTKSVKKGLQTGTIVDVGQSMQPSIEKIVGLKPDAIMLSVYEGMDVKGVDKSGVPLVMLAECMEETPLGRAEWMRFIGRLVGKGEKADSMFRCVAAEYKNQLEQSRTKTPKKVLTEMMYEGVWYVSGGKSYQAALLKDAGGLYPWASDKSAGSLNLAFEEVLSKAIDADVWLIRVFHGPKNLQELYALDPRYVNFNKAKVYLCETSEKDLFQSTSFHPERLLKEYHMIFTGAPDDSLQYFHRLRR